MLALLASTPVTSAQGNQNSSPLRCKFEQNGGTNAQSEGFQEQKLTAITIDFFVQLCYFPPAGKLLEACGLCTAAFYCA